jgi:WD40 repeat protein
VRLWDAETGQALRTLEGPTDSFISSVAWSPDGRRLASAAGEKTVPLWDAETGLALRTLEGHSSLVTSVAWSPDGRRLASASIDNTVRLWDAETGQALRTLEGHSGSVFSVAWWPEVGVQRLASASMATRRFASGTSRPGRRRMCWKGTPVGCNVRRFARTRD